MKRKLITLASSLLKFDLAILFARFFLASQGIGYAIDVKDSGELKALKKVVKKNNPIVFDIGGNIGNFSELVINNFDQSQIHIFEPSLSHFKILEERLGEYKERIFFNNIGLSNESTEAVLSKDFNVTGSATLTSDKRLKNFDIKEKVILKKGSEYLLENGINHIDYMKIDVEGWEMPVILGFQDHLKNKLIDFIQFEVTPKTQDRRESFWDFFDYFTDLNYYVYLIKPNGNLIKIDKNEEVFYSYFPTNFLAVTKEKSSKNTD